MRRLILASCSPRRKEILSIFNKELITVSPDADETVGEDLTPPQTVTLLAARKAEAVLQGHENDIVIGSDTVVYADGKILGKPKDRAEARAMLDTLSGGTHSVFSGAAVICGGREYTGCEETRVTMREITDAEKDAYLRSGEGDDKAGAYGIQGMACAFIEKIDGSYHNVMGLPIFTLCKLMKEAGEELIK